MPSLYFSRNIDWTLWSFVRKYRRASCENFIANWKKSNKLLENKPVCIDFSTPTLHSEIQLFTICDKFISIGEFHFVSIVPKSAALAPNTINIRKLLPLRTKYEILWKFLLYFSECRLINYSVQIDYNRIWN